MPTKPIALRKPRPKTKARSPSKAKPRVLKPPPEAFKGLPEQSLWHQLTKNQKAYVEKRMEGLNPKQAVKTINVDWSLASTYERHPVIKAFLRESGRTALRNLCLTREHVLHGLMDAVDTAATATELTNAWREIGRVIGAYEPEKVQIEVDIGQEKLRTMSLDELAALADMQGVFNGEFEVISERHHARNNAQEIEALGHDGSSSESVEAHGSIPDAEP